MEAAPIYTCQLITIRPAPCLLPSTARAMYHCTVQYSAMQSNTVLRPYTYSALQCTLYSALQQDVLFSVQSSAVVCRAVCLCFAEKPSIMRRICSAVVSHGGASQDFKRFKSISSNNSIKHVIIIIGMVNGHLDDQGSVRTTVKIKNIYKMPLQKVATLLTLRSLGSLFGSKRSSLRNWNHSRLHRS